MTENIKKENIKNILEKSKSLKEAAASLLKKKINKRYYFSPFTDPLLESIYSKEYNNYFAHRLKSYKTTLENFLKHSDFINKPGTFLELGCGSGLFLGLLSKHCPNNSNVSLYGIDISEEMLNLAKKNLAKFKASNINLILGDITKLKQLCKKLRIKPRYIFSLNVIHQIKNIKKLIADAYDILDDDGIIYFETIIRDSDWRKKKRRLLHLLEENPSLFIERFKGHLSAPSKKELIKILEELKLNYNSFISKRYAYLDETFTIIIKK